MLHILQNDSIQLSQRQLQMQMLIEVLITKLGFQ